MASEAHPWTLRLLFLDGKPDGMQAAKVNGWDVRVLTAPRIRIGDALKREEAQSPGVYLLLGESRDESEDENAVLNEGEDDKVALYIGQSANMASRIKSHVTGKGWWTTAVFITAIGEDIGKYVQYLEKELYKTAKSVDAADLDNENEPGGGPRLPEEDEFHMKLFFERLMMILPAMRIDCFLEKNERGMTPERARNEGFPVFKMKPPTVDVDATAVLVNGKMIVLKGSRARENWVGQNGHTNHRRTQRLHETGVLRRKDGYAYFTRNYAFPGTTPAAAVVRGAPANGPDRWRHEETGETYREWEARLLSQNT